MRLPAAAHWHQSDARKNGACEQGAALLCSLMSFFFLRGGLSDDFSKALRKYTDLENRKASGYIEGTEHCLYERYRK